MSGEGDAPMQIQDLEPLVGAWTTEVRLPPGGGEPVRGGTTFEWLEGGGYLVQRTVMDDPIFPRGVMVIGPAAGGDRIVQHYFDSRGVARIYDIRLTDGVLTLWRDDDDFAQRYTGRISADGRTIEGAWEICDDGETWRHDFDLTYTKVA
jgi:hypothetical protein